MKISIYVFGPVPAWEGLMRERHGYKNEEEMYFCFIVCDNTWFCDGGMRRQRNGY